MRADHLAEAVSRHTARHQLPTAAMRLVLRRVPAADSAAVADPGLWRWVRAAVLVVLVEGAVVPELAAVPGGLPLNSATDAGAMSNCTGKRRSLSKTRLPTPSRFR